MPLPREHDISAEACHNHYIAKQQPFILTGKMEGWKALENWSPSYFKSKFPDVRLRACVDLPDTAVPSLHPWRDHLKTLRVDEFVDLMETSERPCYLDSAGIHHFPGEESSVDYSDVIWKDGGRSLVLLWIGSAKTHSGLHFDRYNNFFGQVYGRKVVNLISPEDSKYLYQFPDVVQKSHVDPENPDLERFPKFAETTVYEGVLEPGEMLFIPNLWWHSLRSLDQSISINHWFEQDAGIKQLLPMVKSAGPLSWMRIARDFMAYGVFGMKFEQRLLCEEPNGYWFYTQVRDFVSRRFSS